MLRNVVLLEKGSIGADADERHVELIVWVSQFFVGCSQRTRCEMKEVTKEITPVNYIDLETLKYL